MKRPSTAVRLGCGLATAAALVLLSAPGPHSAVAKRPHQLRPGELVLDAGLGLPGEHEPDPAITDANIADLPAAQMQHDYALAAAKLPGANPDLKWENVGPFGQDDPID